MSDLPESQPPAVFRSRRRLRTLAWHGLRFQARWLWRLLLLAVFVVAAVVLGLRYWLLPRIDEYRPRLVAELSQALGAPVTLGPLRADWQGLRPTLELSDLVVSDRSGHPAIRLARLNASLSWWTLLTGQLRFAEIELTRPNLQVHRSRDGTISLAGIPLNRGQGGDNRFGDWLLSQGSIVASNAQLSWVDEMTSAPPLTLDNVNLVTSNRFRRHRFALVAHAPKEIASTLDVRGDLVGRHLSEFDQWHGDVFVRMDYVDAEKLRPWLAGGIVAKQLYPEQGRGGVRAWLTVADGRVSGATVDLALSGVRTRLGENVPLLPLDRMTGRLNWSLSADKLNLSTQALHLDVAGRPPVPPLTVSLSLDRGPGLRIEGGKLAAPSLQIAPLASLITYLPLPPDLKEPVSGLAPRGEVNDLNLSWHGADRLTAYGLSARFKGLGVAPYLRMPGLSGVEGRIRLDQKGGEAELSAHDLTLRYPAVFPGPLATQKLDVRADWAAEGAADKPVWKVNLRRIALSGPEVTGELGGTYTSEPNGPGIIDLQGQVNRAQAQAVWKYLPLVVDPAAREWLKTALTAGEGVDGKLTLRGHLAGFPWDKDPSGLFRITARAQGVRMAYAPDWPAIEGIDGKMLFEGNRMDIQAEHGRVYGVQLGATTAKISDLEHAELLTVDGSAHGATADFLRFVRESPVHKAVGELLDQSQASGNGVLKLGLKIPLANAENTAVQGEYQLADNTLQLGEGIPKLDKLNGRLLFTEKSFTVPGAQALVLGTPARMTASTDASGAVHFDANGRATAAQLRDSFDLPFERAMQGETDWQAKITLSQQHADLQVSSSLKGMALDLPAPMRKAATDSVPFTLARNLGTDGRARWLVRYDNLLAATLLPGEGKEAMRGGILLSPAAGVQPELPAAGIVISGSLPRLNLDAWSELAGDGGGQNNGGAVSKVDVRIAELTAAQRPWRDVQLRADRDGARWSAQVSAKEAEGRLEWTSDNTGGRNGLLRARLSRLTLPPQPDTVAKPLSSDGKSQRRPPALDLDIDQFQYGEKKLGELKVLAHPEGDDWRLERVRLNLPEGSVSADGLWQDGPTPVLRVNVAVDSKDAGKLLDRLGYPGTLKRGEVKLEGQLAWAGGPFEPDFPSLTGKLNLVARNGQFAKIEPGLGRLLGVLSLQSLPRRISLDFRDVFSEGFAFDEISANARVQQGVMHTDDLKVVGPAAGITMKGDVDLVRETQNLHVRVVPVVSDTVAVGVALANPAAGLLTFLLQKVLRDPLGQMVAYEYDITGSWAQPNVVKTADGRARDKAAPVPSK